MLTSDVLIVSYDSLNFMELRTKLQKNPFIINPVTTLYMLSGGSEVLSAVEHFNSEVSSY